MEIRHKDIKIDPEKPFKNCQLNREPYGRILSEIIANYAEGFVLAINNAWGTGKTTFLKMWQQYLKINGFQTIYFNAWENDFSINPLIALMSELETLVNKNNKDYFKSVINKGAILTKNVLPALLKSVVKKYIDVDTVSDIVENTTKASVEILEDEIKDYTNKKKTVFEFKHELERFIKKSESDKPLVFIIDELDRCRPNYAVELLEQVKHFFSVSGIVFVLSIDKKHLSSSIRGFYGSEQINTDEYLRRFIDLEYSIPEPSNNLFCNYLYNYYHLDQFFDNKRDDQLVRIAEDLFNKSKATLRQQEKAFALTRLVLSSFNPQENKYPSLLFVLIYIKMFENDFYINIKNNTYSAQELCDAFEDIISFNDNNNLNINWFYVEGLLLEFYNNNLDYLNKEKILNFTAENKPICLIKSKLEKKYNREGELANCLTHIQGRSHYGFELTYLLKRIDLLESMKKYDNNN